MVLVFSFALSGCCDMQKCLGIQVLFVGLGKFAKEWLSEEGSDLAVFTHTVDVGRDRLPRWAGDRLVVMAEHSSLFYDVMTDAMMEQAPPPPPPFLVGNAALVPIITMLPELIIIFCPCQPMRAVIPRMLKLLGICCAVATIHGLNDHMQSASLGGE